MPRSLKLPLAAASAAAVLLVGGMSAAAVPAFASALEQAQFDAASQHVALAAHEEPIPIAPRDDVTVTRFTPVQWPIDPRTAISSPFGPRIAPCAGCSTLHRGVDLVPGEGTPIHAIADGTVVEAGFFGELGQHVMVRHVVNGTTVTSVYGHMLAGSATVTVGQRVTRGELLGNVGSTGESTGAHLHFGILDAAGTPEDPMAWMRAHVTQPWR
jgi:murein DD-endopeptidase MepM/ murein hydrolase activator NlpD